MPQRATCTIGTTSWKVEDPDLISIPPDHIEKMIVQGEQLMPVVRKIPMRARMAVARPLIVKDAADERNVSRAFECFDHSHDGVDGFVTISGGKSTSARAMAERVSDLVCSKLNIVAMCSTRSVVSGRCCYPCAARRALYRYGFWYFRSSREAAESGTYSCKCTDFRLWAVVDLDHYPLRVMEEAHSHIGNLSFIYSKPSTSFVSPGEKGNSVAWKEKGRILVRQSIVP